MKSENRKRDAVFAAIIQYLAAARNHASDLGDVEDEVALLDKRIDAFEHKRMLNIADGIEPGEGTYIYNKMLEARELMRAKENGLSQEKEAEFEMYLGMVWEKMTDEEKAEDRKVAQA